MKTFELIKNKCEKRKKYIEKGKKRNSRTRITPHDRTLMVKEIKNASVAFITCQLPLFLNGFSERDRNSRHIRYFMIASLETIVHECTHGGTIRRITSETRNLIIQLCHRVYFGQYIADSKRKLHTEKNRFLLTRNCENLVRKSFSIQGDGIYMKGTWEEYKKGIKLRAQEKLEESS